MKGRHISEPSQRMEVIFKQIKQILADLNHFLKSLFIEFPWQLKMWAV